MHDPMQWPEVELSDLVRIVHGWPFKSELFCDELTGKPIVVNIGNFNYGGGFRFESTTLKEYRGDYPREYELRADDILLVMTCQTAGGEILGIPARVPRDGRTYLHNQRLGKVEIRDRERVDDRFLYWLFLWSELNRELFATATGTKILHTAPRRIEAFKFRLPPVNVQQAIGSLLDSLEAKIQANSKINRTLESMARAMYKAWFVDFEPVKAKVAGAASFNGMPQDVFNRLPAEFVEHPSGLVPRNWEHAPMSELIVILGGGTPKRAEPSYWGGDIPWFSVKDAPSD